MAESTQERDERIRTFLAPAENKADEEINFVTQLLSALSYKWKMSPKAVLKMFEDLAPADEEFVAGWVDLIKSDPPEEGQVPDEIVLLCNDLVASVDTKTQEVTWGPLNAYLESKFPEDEE